MIMELGNDTVRKVWRVVGFVVVCGILLAFVVTTMPWVTG